MTQSSKAGRAMVRETTVLTLGMYVSQLICVVRGFLVAHFLGPALFGIWSLFKTFFQCGSYVGLGSTTAVSRELPYNSGGQREGQNACIKRSALGFALLVSLLVASGTWIYSFLDLAAAYRTELRLAGFAFIFNTMHLYIGQQLRGEKKVYLYAAYLVTYTSICTLFGLLLMLPMGIAGLIAGMLIANVMLIGYLVYSGHLTLALMLDSRVLRGLIGVGFPIMIVEAAPRLMSALDKLVIFWMLDSTATGYYSMAAFFSETINYIPAALGAVLLPRLMYQKGKGVDLTTLGYLFDKPMALLACVVPIFLGLAVVNMEFVLHWLLPDYLPALATLEILVMGLFFSVILTIPQGLLVVFGRHHIFIPAIPLLLLVGTSMNVAAIALGYGIMGVAFASATFYFLVALLVNIYALTVLDRSAVELRKTIIALHTPYIYAVIGVILIDRSGLDRSVILNCVILSSVFLVYCMPIVYWADRKLSLFEQLRSAMTQSRDA